MMTEIMTRERLRREVQSQGLQHEIDRLIALGEQVLQLKPDEQHTTTVPFQVRFGRGYKTVFRMGADYENTGRAGISFPFYIWEILQNPVLERLKKDLLATMPRLDKGGAVRDVRLAITPETIDELIYAICIIWRELRRAKP
jgi:hypothetical protein